MAASKVETLVDIHIVMPHTPATHIAIERDVSKASTGEIIEDEPYSFGYTGKHDHGSLPPLKDDSIYGHMVDALREAKAKTDTVLLAIVQQEAKDGVTAAPSAKSTQKSKTAPAEEEGDEEVAEED